MKKKVIIIVIICVAILIAIISNQSNLFEQNPEKNVTQSKGNLHWTVIKEINLDEQEVQDAVGVIPKWEDLTIAQQFYNVKYNCSTYNTRNTEISANMIGANIGTSVVTGYDQRTQIQYEKNASLFTVNNFSKECVIAVQFEGRSEYFVYINAYYRPETLSDFVEALNLKETISFGTVYYDDFIDGKYMEFEFPNVTDRIIWQKLFDDLTVKNVHSDTEHHSTLMGIGVEIPVLGYKNISVWVTEDGYLCTNILETGKTFYIGENKVQEFMNYIFDNYVAEATVYNDTEKDDSNKEVRNEVIEMIVNENINNDDKIN